MISEERFGELVRLTAESIQGLEEGTTTSVWECLMPHLARAEADELWNGDTRLFELSSEVRRLVSKTSTRMDGSPWAGQVIGLPWNCPFVVRRGPLLLGERAARGSVRATIERLVDGAWKPYFEEVMGPPCGIGDDQQFELFPEGDSDDEDAAVKVWRTGWGVMVFRARGGDDQVVAVDVGEQAMGDGAFPDGEFRVSVSLVEE